MLTGSNVELTAELARAVPIPVIASGGLASVDDIAALRRAGAGIAGAILGRALYDGRVSPPAALAAARA
jgi:phosphoribosylformimino-5-aminoimidazole carboxamide ribotide isomerase